MSGVPLDPSVASPPTPRLTLLYQNPETPLREWYSEIFDPVVDEVVEDGSHTTVLDNCILSDSFVNTHDPAYYRKFHGKNAFLLLSPDEYYRTPLAAYQNFCGVFRSHYAGAFLAERIKQIPTGYNTGFGGLQSEKIASKRQYVWSFLGEAGKSTRPECLRSLMLVTPNYWYASDGWKPHGAVAATSQNLSAQDYTNNLRESAFVPCPLGNVSQESLRVYEALQVGAIPVLEKRRWMDAHRAVLGVHPLPTFFSWHDAAKAMAKWSREPETLDQLQQDCIDWWRDYKLRLSGEVQDFVA
ncbi:MAG TPA: hypothetical protein VGD64_00870, partial [Acidisarcina sp.]